MTREFAKQTTPRRVDTMGTMGTMGTIDSTEGWIGTIDRHDRHEREHVRLLGAMAAVGELDRGFGR